MSSKSPLRLSKLALAAFVLGASSLVLSLATALPALFLGVSAVRAINRSDGRLRGQRLAVAGLALSAFTTAVTLLGLLGMVLLYMQEQSYAAGCANNLRQIGAAFQSYSNRNDLYFPPGTVPNAKLKPQARLSWQAAIVPFFSAAGASEKTAGKQWEELAEQITFKEAWNAPANAGLHRNVMLYLCPTFAHELLPGQIGLTSYVGVAGVGDDAAVLPLSDSNAGVFGYDRLLRVSDISARLDATMAAIETRQENGPWPAGGSPTVRGVPPDHSRCLGKDAAFGGLHRDKTHNTLANILWADGSVRAITEKIDPKLFREEARIKR